jgi:hypothetical protein
VPVITHVSLLRVKVYAPTVTVARSSPVPNSPSAPANWLAKGASMRLRPLPELVLAQRQYDRRDRPGDRLPPRL